MSGFQGKAVFYSLSHSDGVQTGGRIVIDCDAFRQFVQTVKEGLSGIGVGIEVPAAAVGVDVPAVDLVAAVSIFRALVQDIADACIAYGEGQLAALLNKDVGACLVSTVIVDDGAAAQNGRAARFNAQAAANSTLGVEAVSGRGVVVLDGDTGSVVDGQAAVETAIG